MHAIDTLTLMKSFAKSSAKEKMSESHYSDADADRFMKLLGDVLDKGEADVKKHLPSINPTVAQEMGLPPSRG